MKKSKMLLDDELKKVTGGDRADIQKETEDIIPQFDDNVLLTGINNNDQGGLTPEIFKTICTYDDGIDDKGKKLYCCSDVPNRGSKPECATCPARNSNY